MEIIGSNGHGAIFGLCARLDYIDLLLNTLRDKVAAKKDVKAGGGPTIVKTAGLVNVIRGQ
jgi:hypothetical protein